MGVLNPYLPPQRAEPAVITGELPVMVVRHSRGYAIGLCCQGILCVVVGIVFYQLTWLAFALLELSGIAYLMMGMLVPKRVYFEVFRDRLEFLSPVFRRLRMVKPLAGGRARSFHRWFANREDFDRFIAWREAGCLRGDDAMESGR